MRAGCGPRGRSSGRAIEDVAYRVIAAQQRPDHATIARFVERHQDALARAVRRGARRCARGRPGRGRGGRDRRQQGRGERQSRADGRLRAARARDPRGGQGGRRRRGRASTARRAATSCRPSWRPVRAAQKWLARPSGALDERRAEEAGPIPRTAAQAAEGGQAPPRGGAVDRVPRRTRPMSATGLRASERRGRRLGPHTAQALHAAGARRRARSTPPIWTRGWSRASAAWLQGYNAQAVANEHQIVIAAEIDGRLTRLRSPRTDARRRPPRARGRRRHRAPAVVLADAGYWHHRADATHRRRRHPGADPARLRHAQGRRGRAGAAASTTSCASVLAPSTAQRSTGNANSSIEPVFGNTKHNRGIDRFHRRGRAAVRTEWRLITATHNLLKLHRHQIATA